MIVPGVNVIVFDSIARDTGLSRSGLIFTTIGSTSPLRQQILVSSIALIISTTNTTKNSIP